MPLQNPYPGSEILTKDIGQILEEFVASNWGFPTDPEAVGYLVGYTAADVAFGAAGTKMAKSRENITLRAFQIFSDVRDMAIGGHTNDYFELWWIDIFVRDASTTTARSPKLHKILKHVESIFLLNKTGLQPKGISSVNLYKSTPVENPDSEDIYHGILGLELRYVLHKV